jgi:hypothetical protein
MKEFWKKSKIWILGVGYAILVIVFFNAVIFSLVKNIAKNSNEMQEKITDEELSQKRLSEIPEMKKIHERLADEARPLNVILVSEEEVDFIKKIEALADETGNEISLKIDENKPAETPVKPKAGEKGKEEPKLKLPDYDYFTIQMELKGKYSGLVNFLNKMENFEKYANVIEIKASVEEDEPVGRSTNPFFGSVPSSTSAKPGESLKTGLKLIVYIKK